MISNLMIDEKIEGRQTCKGHNVHDHKVEPSDVDTDVSRISSQRRLLYNCHIGRNLRVETCVPGHFPESRNIVQERKDPKGNNITPSSSKGANGSGLEWQTDSDVSFNTDT